jgi:pyruvate, water dikinase
MEASGSWRSSNRQSRLPPNLRYIHFLEELAACDLPLAGGKGANLGRLVRGGFEVPPGFVITTDAYRRSVHSEALPPVAERDAVAGHGEIPIEPPAVPPEVAREVVAAYRRLRAASVAVRSSATAEDLPEASFAGQQESFLHVAGEAALIASVRECWSSLWSERAVRYRAERKIADDTLALAVVVQAMAPHDVAGVVFTLNPVSGRPEELLVNAAEGIGEPVVGGHVVPDQWVARRPDGAVVDFVPGRKPGRDAARTSPLLGARPPTGCLTSSQVSELARLALSVEEYFLGVPQDIEWSYGEEHFHILQARPITTAG